MANSSWISVNLGDVTSECEARAGRDFALLARPVYGVDRVVGLNSTPKYTSSSLERYKLIEPGMFAYNPMRLNIGSIGYCSFNTPPGLVSPDYVVFQCDTSRLNPDFMDYYVGSSPWIDWTTGAGVGSVRMRIYYRELSRMPLSLPSLPEQQAVVEVLTALDDKIELNRRMNETLEAMPQALFKSWFVDFDPVRAKVEGRDPGLPPDLAALFPDAFQDSEIGEIPQGWTTGVLSDLTTFFLGGDWGFDTAAEAEFSPAFCIRGADIPELQIGGIGNMPIRYLKAPSLEKRRLLDSDIVVEISGGSPTQSTGRPVLILQELLQRFGHPLVCSNFCRVLRLKSPSVSKFIYLWLRWLYSKEEFLQYENGTTGIKNFAFTLFSEQFSLAIPTEPTLKAFDELVSPFFARQQTNGTQSETLAAIRDALLPKLLSGELRVAEGCQRIKGTD